MLPYPHKGRIHVSSWDTHYRSGGEIDWAALLGTSFLERLESEGAQDVLDLGCGAGQDALRMAQFVPHVTGVDSSEEAIRRARERFEAAGVEGLFLQHDLAMGLPFPGERFDAVVSNLAFHYFDRPTTARVFAEVARVLRAGGLLLFHVNSSEEGLRRLEEQTISTLESCRDGPGLVAAPLSWT